MKSNIMNWKICEKKYLRKVSLDIERVKSIQKMALLRLSRARATKVSSYKVSLIVEDYYEVIKELLVAYLLKNGLRAKNHQCLISYFYKRNPDKEREANLIGQMSFFRNRLGYYGEKIPYDFYKDKKEEFEHLVDVLLELLK